MLAIMKDKQSQETIWNLSKLNMFVTRAQPVHRDCNLSYFLPWGSILPVGVLNV